MHPSTVEGWPTLFLEIDHFPFYPLKVDRGCCGARRDPTDPGRVSTACAVAKCVAMPTYAARPTVGAWHSSRKSFMPLLVV